MLGIRIRNHFASRRAAERLVASVSAAARRPEFYGEGKAPDTLDGRFEVLSLFAALTLMRLKRDARADRVAQAFTDVFFRHLDAGIREAGVGDLSVAKRMKKMAAAFYGRLSAYSSAIEGGDPAALAQALGRNVWNDSQHAHASALAAYALAAYEVVERAPPEALEDASLWPSPL